MLSPVVDTIDQVRTLLDEYEQFLSDKAEGTMDAYLRTVRQLIVWMAKLPGMEGQFQPQQLTRTTVEQYLTHVEQEGLSLPHRTRVKSTISNFAQFLIEEKRLLQRNPTRDIELPSVELSRCRPLSKEQRFILRSLVLHEGDQRGAALFALGYWADCRVSELSWLQMADAHVYPQGGWLHIGEKQVHQPLYAYLQATHETARTYVFTSQRSERLMEEGISYWFRTLKMQSTENQRDVIQDLTFHALRYGFAHRAREAGWAPEKIVYYFGQVSTQGVPTLQTTIGAPQVSREHVRQKLNNIKGLHTDEGTRK